MLTPKEVASEWRQSLATVYRKIQSGELHAVRLGSETAALRVPREELERIYGDVGATAAAALHSPGTERDAPVDLVVEAPAAAGEAP